MSSRVVCVVALMCAAVHVLAGMRAVVIEGPSREAIELVETAPRPAGA